MGRRKGDSDRIMTRVPLWPECNYSVEHDPPKNKIGAQRSGSDFEKEEGACGYGVFAAQTAETEWSRLLLTLGYNAIIDTKCTPGFRAGCIF